MTTAGRDGNGAATQRFGEEFLVSPSQFPDLADGEGGIATQGATIDFAGGPYLIRGLRDAHATLAGRAWGPLWSHRECHRPALVIEVRPISSEVFRPIDVQSWSNRFDLDYGVDGLRVAGRWGLAHLCWCAHALDRVVFWIPQTLRAADFEGVFENLMRVTLAYRLLEMGGMLLHSSGVVDKSGAHLFYGHSGSGKSTVARLSAATGREILSDDINVLMPDPRRTRRAALAEGQSWWTERLPFSGDMREPIRQRRRCQVVGLWRLEQAGETEAVELSRALAMASLLASAPFLNQDPHRGPALERALLRLVRRFPVHQLRFTADEGLWQVVEQATAQWR